MANIGFLAEIRERRTSRDTNYTLFAERIDIDNVSYDNVDIVARPSLSDSTRFSLVKVVDEDEQSQQCGAVSWVATMTLLRSQVIQLEAQDADAGARVKIDVEVSIPGIRDEGSPAIVGSNVSIAVAPPAAPGC